MFTFNFVILFQSIIIFSRQALFTFSLLLSRSLGSPLVPLVNLLQDDMMMGDMMEAGGAAMDMADMTAMGEMSIEFDIFNEMSNQSTLIEPRAYFSFGSNIYVHLCMY